LPFGDAVRQRPFFHAINVRDIRMIQRRQHFGFALEAQHPIGAACGAVGQNLQRHIPLESRVAGPVHFAHAAGPVASQMCIGSATAIAQVLSDPEP